jgi:heptosyltransferase I
MPPSGSLRFPARRICVVRTSALGDVIHALAMVNGLRAGYPEAHITWVLHPVPWQAVREQPGIDRFVVFPRRGLAGWFHLRRELAGARFDLLLLPQVSFKAGLVAALARADVKVGFDRGRSRELHGMFVDHRIPPRPPGHVQDAYLEFLDYLGIEGYRPEWRIAFSGEERAEQGRFFAALGRPAVAFVVASSNPEKDWPAASFARVMEHVARRGLRPLIVGGPSPRERAVAVAITATCRAEVANGLTESVRATLWQLAGSALVVSPDTGPLHAAVAMDVPTIGLYGYSDPRRCGPYRRFQDLLIDHFNDPGEDEDRPVRRVTRQGRMARIRPEDVIERIELGLTRYRPELAAVLKVPAAAGSSPR